MSGYCFWKKCEMIVLEDRELIEDYGVKISKCGLCCFEGGSLVCLVGYVF